MLFVGPLKLTTLLWSVYPTNSFKKAVNKLQQRHPNKLGFSPLEPTPLDHQGNFVGVS